MAQHIFIGAPLTMALLRDYIFEHRINKGDILMLNQLDFEHIVADIKHTNGGEIPVPLHIFGVLLKKDNATDTDIGHVRVVKNENTTFQ